MSTPRGPRRLEHRTWAALGLLAALAGCGKKGDPLPPLRPTPTAVSGLRLSQRGSELEIAFVAPRASTDGARLPVLDLEVLIATAEGDFLKLARSRTLKAAPGESFALTEPLPAPDTYVRAAVRPAARGHRGSLGEPARLVVLAPLPPPTGLAAAPVAEGIALSWSGVVPPPVTLAPSPTPPPEARSEEAVPPPAQAAPKGEPPAPTIAPPPSSPVGPPEGTPATPAPVPKPTSIPKPTPTPFVPGFFVYRRAPDASYAGPLQPVAVPQNAYADASAQLGQSWCYVVRAVASGDPLVESAPSNEACLDMKDVVPPSPPAGLTLLAREEGVEVTWSPSPESDVRVYRLYRTLRRQRERVAEVAGTETTYLDITAPPGVIVRYTVTAVDEAGNESAPSEPATLAREL